MSKKSIFIGLKEISGYYTALAEGLRELGHDVYIVGPNFHSFGYNYKSDKIVCTLYEKVSAIYLKNSNNFLKKLAIFPFKEFVKFVLFLWTLIKCDRFIFSFGESFYSNRDLILYKIFGKKTLCMVAHGSEIRPAYLDGAISEEYFQGKLFPKWEGYINRISTNIGRIEKNATYILSYPGNCHFLSRKFINTLNIGTPAVLKNFKPRQNKSLAQINVLHIPSNPSAKGSSIIRSTVDKIQSEGIKFQYREVTGIPHTQVIEILSEADLLIDQIYSDAFMPGLATEAAWLNVPTLIAGLGLEEMKAFVLPDLIPPTISVKTEEFESKLKHILMNFDSYVDYGFRAKRYVEKVWNPKEIAKKYVQIFEGNIPVEWTLDPKKVVYLWGACLDKSKIKNRIGMICAKHGSKGLGLSHNQNLEAKMLEAFS